MKNIIKFFGIIVFVAVIGFFFGCATFNEASVADGKEFKFHFGLGHFDQSKSIEEQSFLILLTPPRLDVTLLSINGRDIVRGDGKAQIQIKNLHRHEFIALQPGTYNIRFNYSVGTSAQHTLYTGAFDDVTIEAGEIYFVGGHGTGREVFIADLADYETVTLNPGAASAFINFN